MRIFCYLKTQMEILNSIELFETATIQEDYESIWSALYLGQTVNETRQIEGKYRM